MSSREAPKDAAGAVGNIREVQERLRELPAGVGGYRAAEIARTIYDEARKLHRRSPQDDRVSNTYFEASKRYHQLMKNAYPPNFGQDLKRLGEGEPSGLENVVTFLEADPIFHGTGYLKEELSRLLNRMDLPTNYIQRLQAVILSIVDRRDGREFRAFCRLARRVDSPELREGLTRRLTHDDPNIRRRARWVLEALEQEMQKEKRQ